MKLKTLTLENFKGIREFTINPNSENVAVYGDNGTGKTTLADGFYYLLFEKDSSNKKDFSIKTLNPDGTPIHNLNHEVTGTFVVNGDNVELRKVYKEKWTKKRGTKNHVFDGHTTDYYVDGLGVAKKEFEARVFSLVGKDENTFKLLTNPRYFAEGMKWEDRRKLLLDICGDITDADVIASNEELAELPGLMGKHRLDDFRTVLKQGRAKINEELKQIPARIDEATKSITDASESPNVLHAELEDWQEKQKAKLEETEILKAGGGVAKKK
ncbi:MAG: AAA family ATPase, partial [bacterium]|nr:AAA family ATPase [bacterium]